MGCGCGGGAAPVGSALMTSGDYAALEQPLAVLPPTEPAPEGAEYRVILNGQVAYFGEHTAAFSWQQANGGKLRTV